MVKCPEGRGEVGVELGPERSTLHDAGEHGPETAPTLSPAQQARIAERVSQPAVGWMLGPELLASLRAILRRKSQRGDPRTWMAPYFKRVHNETCNHKGRLVDADGQKANHQPGQAPPVDVEQGAPTEVEQASTAKAEQAPATDGEFWFDYIADMGDSSDAMYATAFACLVDLQLDIPPAQSLPTVQRNRGTAGIHVHGTRPADTGRGNLPRGQFLFVGGDTAYHVADETTIRNRVSRPFEWAHDDLKHRKLLAGSGDERIYGLPGNHDWYDNLHGFSLMFLAIKKPPIKIEGFTPRQHASYVAIQLPHGWQLWGLDIDQGMDDRQASYFGSLLPGSNEDKHRDPQRLILCTPSPPVAFHKAIPPEEHAKALSKLRLSPAYNCKPAGPGNPVDSSLPPGTCRLDLSGDIHHYARYRWDNNDAAPASYMAVVSGLGGAFHHPSFTRAGGLNPAVVYPEPKDSLEAVAPTLLHWKSLISGSWIRAFPVIFGLVLAFGSIDTGGTGWLLSQLLSSIPGVHIPGNGSAPEFGYSLLLLLVLAAGGGLIALSIWLFNQSYSKRLDQAKHSLPLTWNVRTSYIPCMLAAIAAAGVLFSFHLCAFAPKHTGALDVSVDVVILLGMVGGALLGSLYGAKHLTFWRKAYLGGIGLFHGTAQIATPFICARLITINSMTWIVLALFVVWWFAMRNSSMSTGGKAAVLSFMCIAAAVGAHLLVRPDNSTPLVAGLVIAGTWLLLHFSRRLFHQKLVFILLMLLVWAVAWLGGMMVLVCAAEGRMATSTSPWPNLLQFAIGTIMAIPLCTSYFAWYLAAAGLADAHNNEVGGAARVSTFRQIIRFRINDDGLTGYVISVENAKGTEETSPAHTQGKNLRFELVDVFTVTPSRVPERVAGDEIAS